MRFTKLIFVTTPSTTLATTLATALITTLVAPVLRAEDTPALVETAPIQELEIHQELTLVGRTQARRESRIVALIEGRVKSLPAEEGREVRRGDALVTIDCRRGALALDAKKAEAAQAAADAELARKELERARELVQTSVFPERNLDRAVAEEKRTTERHRELEAERGWLELDLEDCTIRAPYDGFTVRKLVDVGEWVEAGTPVYQMVDLAVVKVTADLPERSFGQVAIGSPVTITRTTFNGRREHDAGGKGNGEVLTGKVTGIAPRASETTHTFPVIVEVDNSGGRLASGMLVRATLALKGTFRGLAVSKDAIVRQGERTLVYAVKDGRASEVAVTTGAGLGTLIAIDGDGLEAGMPVIVRGNERIEAGSAVQEDNRTDPDRGGDPGASDPGDSGEESAEPGS